MTTSSWPYSTASPASTRLAPTTPSTGATTSCGTPSMSTDAEPVAGPDPRPGARLRSAAGRCRPPARSRRSVPVAGAAPSRRLAAVAAVAPARPSPIAGRDRRGPARPVALEPRRRMAVAGAARLRAATLALARSALACRRRAPSAGPAEPDAPGALADLELAEARRAELGDEGRQQLVAQAVDRGVVGRPLARRCGRGRRPPGWTGSGTR